GLDGGDDALRLRRVRVVRRARPRRRAARGLPLREELHRGPGVPGGGDPVGSDALDPLDAVLAELAAVARKVDRAEMARLVDVMRGAKRIFVAGIGRSGL